MVTTSLQSAWKARAFLGAWKQSNNLPFMTRLHYFQWRAMRRWIGGTADHIFKLPIKEMLYQDQIDFIITTSFSWFLSDQDMLSQVLSDYFKLADFIPNNAMRTIFDIGANVGMYSLVCTSLAPCVTIHAFEPLPVVFNKFLKNIECNNKSSSINAVPTALSNRSGSDIFEVIFGGTQSSNYPEVLGIDSSEKISVNLSTLDKYIEQNHIDHIDLMKIDTEGSEYDILSGGQQVLSMTERIVLEYHSAQLRSRCTELLIQSGFTELATYNDGENMGIVYFRNSHSP